jgi:hypothetical protein
MMHPRDPIGSNNLRFTVCLPADWRDAQDTIAPRRRPPRHYVAATGRAARNSISLVEASDRAQRANTAGYDLSQGAGG